MIMKHEINVPEGCKVVSVEIISVETTDKMVVVKFEKEEPEFKENDIIYTDNNGYKRLSIIQSFVDNMFISAKATFHITKNFTLTDEHLSFTDVRLATDSEKQLLFDKLKEKCLMFDGESIVRWRAKYNEKYWFIDYSCEVSLDFDSYIYRQNSRHSTGNYFPTKEMAESFQKQYLELLKNFHKNL